MNRRLKIEAGFLRIQLTTSKFPAKAQKHARPILDHLFVDTTASELSCQHAVGGFGQTPWRIHLPLDRKDFNTEVSVSLV